MSEQLAQVLTVLFILGLLALIDAGRWANHKRQAWVSRNTHAVHDRGAVHDAPKTGPKWEQIRVYDEVFDQDDDL